MAKVSIIVPVYNKAEYLKECLDSLINQTIEDIEIICVDDKSTDESLDIIYSYALKDNRIRVITFDDNQGVSMARNTGISNASGEFIAFVDADDFVDLDFYEKLYSVSMGYDCVKGEIWDYDTEINRCSINSTYDLNGKIIATGNPCFFYYGFTSAIYRNDFIKNNNFCFPVGLSYYEDPYFTITVSTKLSSIKVVNGAKYFYRAVMSSLSHNINAEKADQLCISIEKILDYLCNCYISDENKYLIANQLFLMENNPDIVDKIDGSRHHQLKQCYHSLLVKEKIREEIKLSIIVPVYNGSSFLRRTLDCLTLQSMFDIEIICVNDKSTDNSLEILKAYQKNDNRIKLIDCEVNGGESKARNIGLAAALGNYIAFMDQDDMIDLYFYEELYQKAMETAADIVKGNVNVYEYSRLNQILPQNLKKNPLFFAGDWWTAIYRRQMITDYHLELPEGCPLGGDLKFLFDACNVCNQVVSISNVTYYHIVHPDSGDSEITPLHKMKSVISIFQYILNTLEKEKMYEKDKECYIFYYCSYIDHLYERTRRCAEQEGKLLCIDFIFQFYKVCKCKNEVLNRVKQNAPLLSKVLENNQGDFFEQIITKDAIAETFYQYRNTAKVAASIPCSIVVPYINEECIQKYIINNPFLKSEKSNKYHFVDNRIINKPISVIYNEFLDSYDYEKESWFVFMHSDVEFLTFPSLLLKDLKPSKIYGPIGSKIYCDKGKLFVNGKGNVYEKAWDKTFFQNISIKYNDSSVDTVDCLCIIVHSSLVKKYNLRFDENTILDLYAEDFCIHAKREHNIDTEILLFECAHHSSYFKEKYFSKRYLNQLKYLNQKYCDGIYGGTVTPIGGKLLPSMSKDEFMLYRIRQEMLMGKKL